MNDSHEGTKPRRDKEEVAAIVVDCAFQLHRDLGPGLLEAVDEVVLAKLIDERRLRVQRQQPIGIHSAGFTFVEGFRADLMVEDTLLMELTSVENLMPVHSRQVLTYLRLLKLPLGLTTHTSYGSASSREGEMTR
ncbi:MAG: GxxExxY protein [Verrucomicrobiia bacterium]